MSEEKLEPITLCLKTLNENNYVIVKVEIWNLPNLIEYLESVMKHRKIEKNPPYSRIKKLRGWIICFWRIRVKHRLFKMPLK